MRTSLWVSWMSAGLLLAVGLSGLAADNNTGGGQDIFRLGTLLNGTALRGEREAGASVVGMAAACATCHRRSGLGSVEGHIAVPPIIGKYLLRPHATNISDPSLPHVMGYRSTREPYTEKTLARAIREGINPQGRSLNYLMPRYALDDANMASLLAYMTQLTSASVPGVTDEVLHFATIITPGVAPLQRQAMLDVMQHFIDDKNSFIRGGTRAMPANSREIQYRVSRRWQLHVWDLVGSADTWAKQLQAKLTAEPVFAVISGLGVGSWSPIHQFCEQAQLPCLFPNIDEPVVAEKDFYPVYFSRGVWLEADLMAARLVALQASAGITRLVQLYRHGDIGQHAAMALKRAALASGMTVENRVLEAPTQKQVLEKSLHKALTGVDQSTALVLWLRAADLSGLPPSVAPAGVVLVSGLMGGLEESPLPASWRAQALLTYPLDLPELRKVRMNFPLGWFRIHNIPVVAERVQVDTYVACGIVSEMLNDMLDSFVRDYLVERLESMLSHRLVNGYYPRLSLAAGQRFASKGGYLVRFTKPTGPQIVADTDWVVP